MWNIISETWGCKKIFHYLLDENDLTPVYWAVTLKPEPSAEQLRLIVEEALKQVPVRHLPYKEPRKKRIIDELPNQSGVSQFTRQISSGKPYKGYGRRFISGPKTEKA